MTYVCKNSLNNSGTYTGKEPSPKGLGYCARFEKIGTKKKGKDGNMWIVSERANGTRAWIKHDNVKPKKVRPDKVNPKKANPNKIKPNKKNNESTNDKPRIDKPRIDKPRINKPRIDEPTNTQKAQTINNINKNKWNNLNNKNIKKEQRDIYDILMRLGAVFNDHGINVFYCLWHQRGNEQGYYHYIMDEPWDMLADKDRDYLKKPYIIIAFKLYYDSSEKREYFAKLEDVCLQHTLTKKYKPIIDSILFKEFKHLYSWNGTPQKAICIRV